MSSEDTVTNFLEKNKDTISQTLQDAAAASEQPLMKYLFKQDPAEASNTGGKKSNKKTLGLKFKESLDNLMVALYATEPAFIRCVKSNHAKKPGIFTGSLALSQLRNGGLFEAIKIRRAGYGYRIPLERFMRQYSVLYVDLSAESRKKGVDTRAVVEELLKRFIKDNAGPNLIPDNFIIGKTKVFLKAVAEQNLLEKKRRAVLSVRMLRVQARARGYLFRLAKWKEEHKAEMEARRAAEKAAREERMRVEGEKIRRECTIRIQTIARIRYAKKYVKSMNDSRVLQRAEADAEKNRDVAPLRNIIDTFRAKVAKDPDGNSMLARRLQKSEARLAQLIDEQEVLEAISEAIANLDLDELAECIKRAGELKILYLPEVQRAREHWEDIKEKRSIVNRLTEFLRDESVDEDIPKLLQKARNAGIKEDFLDQIEEVYTEVAPRLEARNNIRKGVEYVDSKSLRKGLEAMREIVKKEPTYGIKELRAAEQLIRMLDFETELMTPSRQSGEDEGPRLNDELIQLCGFIQQATTPAQKNEAENDLRAVLPNREAYERVIRAYKWRTVYCEWMYFRELEQDDDSLFDMMPRGMAGDNADEESFMGLNAQSARRLYSVAHADYVHGDDTPPSFAGALTTNILGRSKELICKPETQPRQRPPMNRRIPVPRQKKPSKARPKSAEEEKLEKSRMSLQRKKKQASTSSNKWSSAVAESKRLKHIRKTTRFK